MTFCGKMWGYPVCGGEFFLPMPPPLHRPPSPIWALCVNLQQLNSPFIFRIVVVACSTRLHFFTLQYYSSNSWTPFYSGAQQFNNSKAKRILESFSVGQLDRSHRDVKFILSYSSQRSEYG
ncbi:uncharacterized protein [Miscanthus floridulus]|uniref:uncharacterized protein isoform X1 n=1 Tax=Miscanthus floridulus TaxID=154761 RepID=UPI00345761DB